MWVDTHTHLYDPSFQIDGGGEAAVQRAIAAGVEHMIFPNVDQTTVAPLMELAAKFPDHVSVAMGLHPTELGDDWISTVKKMLNLVDSNLPGIVAIGEIGIDLYWDRSRVDDQMAAFRYQLSAAVERDLPVIIHCREALDEVLSAISEVPDVRGVMHSFGGTREDVRRIRDCADMYFGINGIVTFKNCHVSNALCEIGLDRLLVETDSPYLAPVPKRGRRNESAYLTFITRFIADRMSVTVEQLAHATTANAKRLFNF